MFKKLVLGTVQFGLKYGVNHKHKPTPGEAHQIIESAQEHGIEELDTAAGYGNALEILAEYQNLKNLKIVTKVVLEKSDFSTQLDENLKRLRVLSVDGCYLHRYANISHPSLFADVKKAKEQGLLKRFGVSIYTTEELESMVDNPHVDIVQVPFNIFDQDSRKILLLQQARKNKKTIYARSIFLQGLFFMQPNQVPEILRELSTPLENLQKIASDEKIDLHSLCLKYVLDQECIDKVIIGVENQEQLIKNLSATKVQISPRLRDQLGRLTVKNAKLINPMFWK